MASVTPGYVFTSGSDPLTYQKLNLLGTPTVSIGAGEVTLSMLSALSSAGRLIGSSPTSAAVTSFLINNTGLTLHSGNGITFGDSTGESGIAMGQSATARARVYWAWNGSNEADALFYLQGAFGNVSTAVSGFSITKLAVSVQANSFGVAQFQSNTDIVMSGAKSTGSTGGFLVTTTCPGTPSGIPTNASNGAPMIYDSTANKIWFYNGSWRGVVVS